MATFKFEMKLKAPIELRIYEIDEDTYSDYDGEDDLEDNAWDIIENAAEVANGIVMYNDDFCNSETFSLIVKDENDNVVYETNDPSSIPMFYRYTYDNKSYKYYDEEEDEEGDPIAHDLSDFEFNELPDGFYLVENIDCKWTYFEGEIETDEFDPSKLAFYPSETLDDYLCEDDVFLSCIRYDGARIEFEDDIWDDSYGSHYKLLTKEDGHFSDHH